MMAAQNLFSVKCLVATWIVMAQSYPDVTKMALKVLIPFATTNECGAAFSTLLAIKIKSRYRLKATNDMRVALVKAKPNL